MMITVSQRTLENQLKVLTQITDPYLYTLTTNMASHTVGSTMQNGLPFPATPTLVLH